MWRRHLLLLLVPLLLILAACDTDTDDDADDDDATTPTTEETEAPDEADDEADNEGDDEDTADTGERQQLQFALNAADLGTLDPHFAATTNDRTAVDMIFNGLVRYPPGDSSALEFEPDIATEVPEPEETDAGQVWTFEIQEGVMCHPSAETDAYELTADDVVYSLERAANPDTSAYAGEYEGMTFESTGDYTVEITVEQPLSESLFLPKVSDYSGGFIVCSEAVEALGDEAFATNPVGTGPFMFDSYTAQNSIELVAHDDYFRGQPNLAGVNLRFMPDDSSRELALETEELDVVYGRADTQWVDRIGGMEGTTVDVIGVPEVTFLNFNIEAEYLEDIQVRQAIAHAIDRDEHLALFGEPVAQYEYSLVPPDFLPGGLTEDEVREMDLAYDYDPDRARELLEEAGYPDGFELRLITSELEPYLRNFEALQAELAEVGIDLELEVVDHSTMHAQIREDVNPIVIYMAWRPSSDAYLTRFAHSDSIVVTGESPDTNFSHYAGIDDLIEEARFETDVEQQEELWKQANAQLLEDLAIYPLHYINQVYARSDSVDFGHEPVSSVALYPQITEQTQISEE